MSSHVSRHWRVATAVVLTALGVSVHSMPREQAIQETQRLNQQALELYEQGHYEEATVLAQRAVAVSEAELGLQRPETASSLDTLAQLYRATGDYVRAEQLFERALVIRRKTLGAAHPTTADSLYHLAILYYTTGAYARSVSLHQQALAIRERVLSPEHPSIGESVNGLGNVYLATGAYAKAEPLYRRAVAIRQKALGPQHPKTAGSLSNLANLYRLTGAYAKAEPLHLQALTILEKAFGPEHPAIGDALCNLAIVYYETGAYAKAEPRYQRALAIFQKAFGPEHPRTADTLNNLANLYSKNGAYAKAEPLHQQALAISEKVSPEHPRTAAALNNLANLYSATSAYDKAEALQQRALAIYEKALGPEHPYAASSLNNLASVYTRIGNYAKAEQLNRQALAIFETTLGPEHPYTASSLGKLADMYSASGAYAKAEPLYQRAQVIQSKNSERFLLTGSESRKQAYLEEIAQNTHRDVSFSVAVRSRASIALGLTSVLQYKGRLLDEISGSVARLRQSVKPADRDLFDRLAQVATQLSGLTYQGVDESASRFRQRLAELSQRQEELESDLAKRSMAFRQQVTPVTLDAVSRAIPSGAVLVEWFRYQPFDPKATGARAPQLPPRYVAYVLRPNDTASLVEVGEAQEIETSVREFLETVKDPTRQDFKERALAVSDKIIGPLRAHLKGAERVLVSPDGVLNLVPMAALLDENGEYLLQRFEITYLTSGRDVLRMASQSRAQNGPIIIADPDYGAPAQLITAAVRPQEEQRAAEPDRSGILFKPLANTALEAQAIQGLLKLDDSRVMMRLEATESNLKRLHGPRILHVASHGFFLSDQDLTAGFGTRAGLAMHSGENPLLRAGVALAGANRRRSGPREDGILTALEAAQLDLHGTELVVLSACESGVGEVQNGEGVYGLRRALFIAGAQTQVTSLWKISDRSTGTMMVDYYQRLLKGQGRSAALRDAQQQMRARPGRSHPYYWAGFVPIGDWAPLKLNQNVAAR
jgi:CHAT domain-containing protein